MSTQLGRVGEDIAASYLEDKGFKIIERNYRFERAEVDLVCFLPDVDYAKGGELVFVEVKTRSSLVHGRPEEAVDVAKMKNVVQAAKAFIYEYKLDGAPTRFDVVTILMRETGSHHVEHFINAFDSDGNVLYPGR